MTSKLYVTDSSIEIHGEPPSIYPLHSNRSRTIFTTTILNLPEVINELRGAAAIDAAPPKIQDLYHRELVVRERIVDLLENGPRSSCVINKSLTLMKHQQLGREIAELRDRFAFFYDTRTGKTPLALSIINDDLQANPNHKWLVICPLILIDNAWLEDAKRFLPDMRIISCHASTPAKRVKLIESDADVYITNTESFIKYREYFKDIHGVFVDESSDMKSTKSKVSKEIVDFAQTVKRFYLLSGTPAPNGEYEYYMQLRAVDYYGLHQSYKQFKEYYFVNMSYNPQYEKLVLRPDRRDELLNLVKRYSVFIDKEEVLTTPGRTFHEVELELPKDLKAHYNKFKNELYTTLDNNVTITAPSAAAKLNKLNQITSGFIMDTQAAKENKFYGTEKEEWYLLDDYRFTELQRLLDSEEIRGRQVLIWANYRREFDIIKRLLGDTCALVYGGTTLEEKNAAISAFKRNEVRYLVANPASADKGLTLTNAHIAIYFSLNWSYELFKQSMERIYGGIHSQPQHCHYYILIAKGTIDRILYSDVLQGKGKASYAVLDHLKPGGELR